MEIISYIIHKVSLCGGYLLEKEEKKGLVGGENKWEKRGTGKEKGLGGGGENKWEKKRGTGKEKGLGGGENKWEKRGTGKERVEEEERTNGKRREGEEKREQLLQVAESTWGL